MFSNHLDVGFNQRSWADHHAAEGDAACDGLYSPDGERCDPLAANVTSEYFNVFLPRAAKMADVARQTGGDRYIYMTQPWIVDLFLDCHVRVGKSKYGSSENKHARPFQFNVTFYSH